MSTDHNEDLAKDRGLRVRRCTFDELASAPNFKDLLEEYANYGVPEMPHPNTKLGIYKQLDDAGAIIIIGAFYGEELAGFMGVIFPVSAHYGEQLFTTESFFVSAKYKKTWAAIKMIHLAEALSREAGALGFSITLPAAKGSNVKAPMEKLGYREAARTYIMGFRDG